MESKLDAAKQNEKPQDRQLKHKKAYLGRPTYQNYKETSPCHLHSINATLLSTNASLHSIRASLHPIHDFLHQSTSLCTGLYSISPCPQSNGLSDNTTGRQFQRSSSAEHDTTFQVYTKAPGELPMQLRHRVFFEINCCL